MNLVLRHRVQKEIENRAIPVSSIALLVAEYLNDCQCSCHSTTYDNQPLSLTSCRKMNCWNPDCESSLCQACVVICHCGKFTCRYCIDLVGHSWRVCKECYEPACPLCTQKVCDECHKPCCVLKFCKGCNATLCDRCCVACNYCRKRFCTNCIWGDICTTCFVPNQKK